MAPKRFRLLNPESSRWYAVYVTVLFIPAAVVFYLAHEVFSFDEFSQITNVSIFLMVLLGAAMLFPVPVAHRARTSEFSFIFPAFFVLVALGFPFSALLVGFLGRIIDDLRKGKPLATQAFSLGGGTLELLGLALVMNQLSLYDVPSTESLGGRFLLAVAISYGGLFVINSLVTIPAIALVNRVSLRSAAKVDTIFELSVATVLTLSAAAMLGLALTYPALLVAFVGVAAVSVLNSSLALRRLYTSRTDQLTKLPNRRAMEDRVPDLLSRARKHDRLVGIGVIDLDGFKLVNDSLGHHAGDELLSTLSARVSAMTELSDNDFFGRLGGDEFVLVATETRPGRVLEVVRAVTSVMSLPLEIDGETVSVGASIGLAFAPDEGGRLGELLSIADRQMYTKKFERKAAAALKQEQPVR